MTRRIGTYDHPLMQKGEILLTYATPAVASRLQYRTLRVGGPTNDGLGEAADPHGSNETDDITCPVFIGEDEAIEKGIIPPRAKP